MYVITCHIDSLSDAGSCLGKVLLGFLLLKHLYLAALLGQCYHNKRALHYTNREYHMAIEITRKRFTIDEYHRMAEAGILHEDDRVELIDGETVEMSPIGTHHAACVKRLIALLTEQIGRRA